MPSESDNTQSPPGACPPATSVAEEREHELATEVRVLSRLHEANSRLWGMRSLDEGLEEMLAATMELLGADYGNVQLYDARREVLNIAVHRGFGPAFLDAFREVGVQHDSACGRALRAGEQALIEDVETDPPFAPYRPIARAAGYRAVLSTPLTGRDGAPLGMISVHFRAPHRPHEGERRAVDVYARRAADFIERCRLEEALQLQSEHLRLALESAGMGTWQRDLATDELTWSQDCRRILGFPADGDISYDQFIAAIHPDDQSRLLDTVRGAIESRDGFDCEYRIRRPDGAPRWIRVAAQIRVSTGGDPNRLDGVVGDITERKQREEGLLKAQQRLAEAQAIAQIGSFDYDLATRQAVWSDEQYRIFRRDPAGPAPHFDDILACVHPEDMAATREAFATALEREADFEHEHRLRHQDGQVRWVRDVAHPCRNAAGRLVRYLGTTQDITDRKLADLALQSEREQLATLIDSATDEIWLTDADGRLLWVNPAGRRAFGLEDDSDTTIRRLASRLDTRNPDGKPRPLEEAPPLRALRSGSVVHQEEIVHLPDTGEYRHRSVIASPVRDSQGRVTGVVSIVRDITAERKITQELKRTQQLLEEGERIAHLGSWEYDVANQRTTWSAEECRIYGLEPGDPSPDYAAMLRECIHPEDAGRLDRTFQDALERLAPYELENRILRPDGSVRTVQDIAHPYFDESGALVKYIGTTLDITELRALEADLRHSEKVLRLATEGADLGVWYWDLGAQTLEWSEQCKTHLGLPAGEIPSFDQFYANLHPDDRGRVEASIQKAVEQGENYAAEYRVFWPDGSLHWISAPGRVYRAPNGSPLGMGGVTQDITTLMNTRETLRRSEERFRLAMEATNDGIWDWNIQTGQCYYSPGYFHMLGYTPDTLPERVDTWIGLLHPDEREAIVAEAQRRIATDGGYELEFRLCHRAGDYVWVSSRGQVVERDAAGQPLRAIGTHVDITERKRILEELAELNRDLERKVAERTAQAEAANAAKSSFLAHMSHEIRTPMNAVLGLAQLLAEEPLAPGQLAMIRHIREAGDNLLRIINDILDFSKIEAGQLELENRPFALPPVVMRVQSLLGETARKKNLVLEVDAPAPPGRLLGDALRLEQVLINLAGNALKFTQQGGVTLRVRPLAVDADNARLRFEVSDTGIGLTPEARARLFQPFTQTDASITRRFGGTGLGLSISKHLVELMGGCIGVESQEGAGSTFWFELPFPRCEAEEPSAAAPAASVGPRLAGLRLLVADDNAVNLMLAERVLRKEGAEVTTVRDGQEALDQLRAAPDAFDGVLMDIQMPVMDGLTATRAIRAELGLTALPVIALTAGVLPEERQAALEAGVNDFLPKPMDLHRMAEMIRDYCRPAARD
ncbi:MAG: PAS domain-containing protein [Methylococcus sp.]